MFLASFLPPSLFPSFLPEGLEFRVFGQGLGFRVWEFRHHGTTGDVETPAFSILMPSGTKVFLFRTAVAAMMVLGLQLPNRVPLSVHVPI